MAFPSSRPPLKSKFSQCYTALLAGDQPWLPQSSFVESVSTSSEASPVRPVTTLSRSKSSAKSNSAPRTRYYADLLCLAVETQLVVDLLNAVSIDSLLDDDPNSKSGMIRDNVGSLWRESIRVWRDNDEDPVRRKNAIDTLVALSFPILNKKFSNYVFDIVSIFAGSMDEADEVFTSLIDAIDEALRGYHPPRTKLPSTFTLDSQQQTVETPSSTLVDHDAQHRALQLALLWLCNVSQTSLGAYFLRRDLFVTISSFTLPSSGSLFAYEASLFIGLLATVGHGSSSSLSLGLSTSNPYARRLRDWVDQQSMDAILLAASSALQQSIEKYVEIADDSIPSLASSIAGIASFKWMSGRATSYSGLGNDVTLNDQQTKASSSSSSSTVSPVPKTFHHLPPHVSVILLPLFLLARSNQAFTSLILRSPPATDMDTQENGATHNPELQVGNTFYCHLLSLSSYLGSHASNTLRSRSYARIALLLLLVLLYDPKSNRAILDESLHLVQNVRICRQREPPLSIPRKKPTRLVICNLDVAACHLRYNLSKKLDVPSHIVSLKIIQRCIVLCSQERVFFEYDWNDIWSSIFHLAHFIGSRHSEMKGVNSNLSQLVCAIMSTLNSALVRSDHFLETTKQIHHLIYELVRCCSVLKRIVLILDPVSTSSTTTTTNGGTFTTESSLETSSLVFSSSSSSTPPTPLKLYSQVPGWRNIERVILAVESKMSEWVNQKPPARKNKTPDIGTVMKMIASLDLETLLAGGGIEEDNPMTLETNGTGPPHHELEWLDKIQESSLPEFIRHSCQDVLKILPIY